MEEERKQEKEKRRRGKMKRQKGEAISSFIRKYSLSKK